MKAFNLFSVMNDNIIINLSGIDNNGKEVKYNFKEHKWGEDALFRPEGLITLKEFKSMKIYRITKSNQLITFSSIPAHTVEAFKEANIPNDSICVIKVKTGLSPKAQQRAINRTLNAPNPNKKRRKSWVPKGRKSSYSTVTRVRETIKEDDYTRKEEINGN